MGLGLRALLLAIVAFALCARACGADTIVAQASAAELRKELSQSTSSAGSLRATRATADGLNEVQTPPPSAGVGLTSDNGAAQAGTPRSPKTAAALRTAMANPLTSTKPPSIPAASPTIRTAPLTIVRTAPPSVRTTSKPLAVPQAAYRSVSSQRTTSALRAQASKVMRPTSTLRGKTTASALRGKTTSSTLRNAQRTSTNQLRVKGGTARNGVPMKTIYVFGPESTGTRFMTRSLSKLFEPTSRWDGEYPACKTHIDPEGGGYVNIQHLSLPWGGWCDGAIRIVPGIDMCNVLQKPKYGRFFVDIETLLKRVPNARAIVLSRDAKYTMRSVLKHHCSNRVMAAKEHQTALDLISKAVESPEVGNRVLRVEYESLGLLPELTWSQIMRFADIQRPANFSPPAFRSGNHRRRLLREAREAASEAAVGVDQDQQQVI